MVQFHGAKTGRSSGNEKSASPKALPPAVLAHAKFGASKSERWLNCPGSITLEEKAPTPPESPWAKEGTEGHGVVEFLLKNRRGTKIPEAAVNIARKQHPIDMVEHAYQTAQVIMGELEKYPGAEFLCETRVDASAFTCPDQFGTVDAAIVDLFGRLVVIDFKYGAGIAVDPDGEDGAGNPQLAYYALGLAHQYGFCFEDVELIVIQPRAYHPSGETVRRHVLTIAELESWIPVFKDGVTIAKRAASSAIFDDYIVPGKWCKFCPAGVICPKLKEKAMEEAGMEFHDGYLESVPDPLAAKIERLPDLLNAADRLEVWIEKIREYAFSLLNRGGEIPGYKLVKKKAHRKWMDHAADTLSDFGWDDKIYQTPKMISPAQFEKIIGKDPMMRKLIESITVKESSGVTMVRADDSRAAEMRNVGEEYE